jgi:Bacterial transcriptional activator domain
VARLRASLAAVGRELIETTAGGYRLAASGVEVDANSFERRAGEGHRRMGIGDLTGAIAVLSDAVAEWRGLPYTDFPDVEFAAYERCRLEDEDLAEARLAMSEKPDVPRPRSPGVRRHRMLEDDVRSAIRFDSRAPIGKSGAGSLRLSVVRSPVLLRR